MNLAPASGVCALTLSRLSDFFQFLQECSQDKLPTSSSGQQMLKECLFLALHQAAKGDH